MLGVTVNFMCQLAMKKLGHSTQIFGQILLQMFQ
jgi:hypothetical protein